MCGAVVYQKQKKNDNHRPRKEVYFASNFTIFITKKKKNSTQDEY